MKPIIKYASIALCTLVGLTSCAPRERMPNGKNAVNCKPYQDEEDLSGKYIKCRTEDPFRFSFIYGTVEHIGYVKEFAPPESQVNSLVNILLIAPKKTGEAYKESILVVKPENEDYETRTCIIEPDDGEKIKLDILLTQIQKGDRVKIPTIRKVGHVVERNDRKRPLYKILSSIDYCKVEHIRKLPDTD
ncbi:hypothetical protein HOK51_11550 [Candidatus Woesearchaeota archaeon]|jgi:hypothetical protein|nr:hypothetical protein [Candidatus Woesearchaeota archaeon]MBT6520456.1 hypothetical protein [Candidatus Woesearchaeota archaeon]MBT7367350.1 hypothetical protein [Candidatus Woesearchaeota archaeon]